MVNTLIFLETPTDVSNVDKKQLLSSESKVFSFNVYGHKILEKEKISHVIAEEYLDQEDKLKIFDSTVSHYAWYKKFNDDKNLECCGVNLLEILDTAEFHQLLISGLSNFLIIKRIIEKEKPERIIASTYHSQIIKSINSKIKVDVYNKKSIDYLAWDRIEIKFNIGNLPVSFHLSRNKYAKLKEVFETIVSAVFKFWFNFNKKTTILLLEFDPSSYVDLLQHLSKYGKNVLLYNRRKSAIWNMSSIKTLHKTKCKLLNFKKIEAKLKPQIVSSTNQYLVELEKIWQNEEILNSFMFEDTTFWYGIKDSLTQVYRNRLHEYVSLIFISKHLLEHVNISCIVSLNVVGESEKSVLHINKQKIPSIMLEHGYVNLVSETSRYDVLNMYTLFDDKIAVWGETQKQYLEERKIANDRILVVGSPKYDSLFNRNTKSRPIIKKTILLALHPITQITGQTNTNSYIRFEKFLIKFCNIVKKIPNVNMIVKLHPTQDVHNSDIKEIFKKIDNTMPVYHSKSVIELMESSDVLVTMSPEGSDPSTVILEGIILEKPVMNIILDDNFYEFQYVKDHAVLSMSDNDDIESNLRNMLFDEKFRDALIKNGKTHLKHYLSHAGTSSEYLANVLNSL